MILLHLELEIMVAQPLPTGDAGGHAGKQMIARPHGKAASTATGQHSSRHRHRHRHTHTHTQVQTLTKKQTQPEAQKHRLTHSCR